MTQGQKDALWAAAYMRKFDSYAYAIARAGDNEDPGVQQEVIDLCAEKSIERANEVVAIAQRVSNLMDVFGPTIILK